MRKRQRYNLKKIIPTVLLALATVPMFTSCGKEDPFPTPQKKFNRSLTYEFGQEYSQFEQLGS